LRRNSDTASYVSGIVILNGLDIITSANIDRATPEMNMAAATARISSSAIGREKFNRLNSEANVFVVANLNVLDIDIRSLTYIPTDPRQGGWTRASLCLD
jgi:hypothetical protein